MKFKKQVSVRLSAMVADTFYNVAKLKEKFKKFFIANFFQKQKNYINNIPGFPAGPWYFKKLGWANTPL
jgi:predicted PolB exonuclease-like 3'-5' exonuclease